MDDLQRERERQQRWRIAAAVFCVFVALRLLIVADGSPPLLAWVAYPIYCVYALAPVVLAVALARRLRGRRVTPLPILPARWASDSRALYALLALVAVGSLLREGALGPQMSVDFHAFRANDEMQLDTTTTGSAQTTGDGLPVEFAGRPALCQLDCTPAGQTCDAVMAQIQCASPHHVAGAFPVRVTGTIGVGADPWCYTPWYKDGAAQISAEIDVSVAEGGGSASKHLSMTGSITQDAFGPMSCRAFRQRIGTRIGTNIANSIDNVLGGRSPGS